jgi:hypothetical protein
LPFGEGRAGIILIDLTNLDLFVEGDPHAAFRVLRESAPVFLA